MKLDLKKLTNRHRSNKDGKQALIARCPACAEEGHDRRGDHLIVFRDGRFGCVVFPGVAPSAHRHRQRIWQLVGTGATGARNAPSRRYTPKSRLRSYPATIRVLGRIVSSLSERGVPEAAQDGAASS